MIQEDFREARRAAGLGQPNWKPLQAGEEWDGFLAQMWHYQWTNVRTELTPAISRTILHESAGVIDIAVKLYILGQMRAIYRGETLGQPEALDEGLFAAVAAEEFACVRPMIEALRAGNEEALARYPDLKPLHQHVDALVAKGAGMTMAEFRRLRDLRELTRAAEQSSRTAPWATIRAALQQRGKTEDVIDRLLAEALERNPGGDVMSMSKTIFELLEVEPRPAKASPPRRRRAGKKASEVDVPSPEPDTRKAAAFVNGLMQA